jgi:hypothetical protein
VERTGRTKSTFFGDSRMNSLMRFGSIFDVADDPRRVAPPGCAPGEKDIPEDNEPMFDELHEPDQRSTIRDYLRKWPYERGLLGEAINEHRYNGQIEAAFFANDIAQLGTLVDIAIREYLGAQVQREWDEKGDE